MVANNRLKYIQSGLDYLKNRCSISMVQFEDEEAASICTEMCKRLPEDILRSCY
jgi:hypothetical protein